MEDHAAAEPPQFKIAYLSEYPQFVEQIARSDFAEWPEGYKEFGISDVQEAIEDLHQQLKSNKNNTTMPVPIVVVTDIPCDEGEEETKGGVGEAAPPRRKTKTVLCGSVNIESRDMSTHMHLTPWMTSVYVQPAWRKKGVGQMLVEKVKEVARDKLGFTHLYLFTENNHNSLALYKRCGWEVVEECIHWGHPVRIMKITF